MNKIICSKKLPGELSKADINPKRFHPSYVSNFYLTIPNFLKELKEFSQMVLVVRAKPGEEYLVGSPF
jgi:hypothetical protein